MNKKAEDSHMKPAMSMSRMLATMLMLFTLSSLVVTSVIQITLNFQLQDRAISEQQQAIVLGAANKVSNAIGQVFGMLETAAKVGRPFTRTDGERWLLLHSLLELNENFSEIALLNSNGHELVKVSRHRVYQQSDLTSDASSALFEQISRKLKFTGSLFIDEYSNEPVIMVAIPITNLVGDFSGGLVAKVNLKFVWDMVDSLKFGDDGVVYIVDSQGFLIAYHDEKRVLQGESLTDLEQVSAFMHSGEKDDLNRTILATGLTASHVLTTFFPLDVPDWAVIAEVPVFEAYQSVVLSMSLLILVLVIIAISAIYLGVHFARQLAAPVQELTKTATQIADGHLELDAPVKGSVEVRGLATAFNSMTTQLRTLIYSLERKVSELEQAEIKLDNHRKNLETEVTIRTKDLKESNRALKTSEHNLKRANERLTELDQLKSMFIASMSHELRTPLNSIISFSGILLQNIIGELNDRQRDSVERVQRSGRHLLALITDIIDISKIEAGRMDAFVETFSLEELVSEAVEVIRPQAEAKQLELTVQVKRWPTVQTDRLRLMQCLLNLLSNAVKYSEEGEIDVLLSEHGEAIEIAVSDTGIGIAENEMKKLFEPFERIESHLKVKAGGTGLGLYLTKKIATDLLQGEVIAESRHGEGSTFILRFPKAIDSDKTKALIEEPT